MWNGRSYNYFKIHYGLYKVYGPIVKCEGYVKQLYYKFNNSDTDVHDDEWKA